MKTDPARMLALTDEIAAKANAVPAGQGLTHAQRTGGYVPPVLIDVFARAPYGHEADRAATIEYLKTL